MKKQFNIFEKRKEDEIGGMKVKLLIQEKNTQLKDLWDVIQMLHDANLSYSPNRLIGGD